MVSIKTFVAVAAVGLSLWTAVARAGDCTGYVVGVRPISQYDHDRGNGFLALRSGPGSDFNQVGEVYLGDEYWVSERRGDWAYVGCTNGGCTTPLWGPPYPEGWAYAKYLDYDGICP